MVALPKPFPLIFISVDGSCARAKQNLLLLEKYVWGLPCFQKVIIYFTNKAFQFVAMVYHKHAIDEWWCHLLRQVPYNSVVRILVLSLHRFTCQQKSWVRVWMNVVLFLRNMRRLRDLLSPRRKRSAAKETPLFSPVLSCRVNMYVLTLLLVVQLMCMCKLLAAGING